MNQWCIEWEGLNIAVEHGAFAGMVLAINGTVVDDSPVSDWNALFTYTAAHVARAGATHLVEVFAWPDIFPKTTYCLVVDDKLVARNRDSKVLPPNWHHRDELLRAGFGRFLLSRTNIPKTLLLCVVGAGLGEATTRGDLSAALIGALAGLVIALLWASLHWRSWRRIARERRAKLNRPPLAA